MNEFNEKYTAICGSDCDPHIVGIYTTGAIFQSLHEELEDWKADYPECEPKEFEIEITVREKK